MSETPRDSIAPVPAGMVRLCEYGAVPPGHMATVTVHATAPGAMYGYPPVRLEHVTRGYSAAGSCAIWREARWSVLYPFEGAQHGRSFLESDEAAARACFASLTNPAAVAVRRAQDTDLALQARDTDLAESSVDMSRVTAAKTYRSAWQWKADMRGLREFRGYYKTKAQALASARREIARRTMGGV